MQANASYQNATYMNALKCTIMGFMRYHAACEESIRMECNENVENASECKKVTSDNTMPSNDSISSSPQEERRWLTGYWV
jgi:hypothetical protein